MICSIIKRYRKDEAGGTIVMAAALFPVMIGAMGLGAETGYWYLTERKLQYAADVAAHAAATNKRAGAQQSAMTEAARKVATQAGVPAAASLSVNYPPTTGNRAGQSDSVEVVVQENLPRLFTSVFASGNVALSGRAVARIAGGTKACVLALSKTAPGAATVSGSAALTLSGCDLASNSSAANSFVLQSGSAAVTAGCLFTVGQAVTTTRLTLNDCTTPREFSPPVVDPYQSVVEPSDSGACSNKNVGNPNHSIRVTPTRTLPNGTPVMRFCNGLMVHGNVTFSPGIYIVEGGTFTANATTTITADGATFFFTNGGSARLNGSATLNLTAPTAPSPYAGLIFWGSASGSNVSHQVNGGSSSVLQGAVYTPAAALDFNGNSALNGGCTQLIANTILISGSSSIGSSCDTTGTRTALVNQAVEVVE